MNDVYSKFSHCQDNLPLARNEVYVCTLWGQWFFLPAISGLRSKRYGFRVYVLGLGDKPLKFGSCCKPSQVCAANSMTQHPFLACMLCLQCVDCMYFHMCIARAHTFQTMQAQHACVKQMLCDTVCCADLRWQAGRTNFQGSAPKPWNINPNPYLLLRRPEMAGRKNHWPHSVQTYTSLRARGRLS